MKCFSAWLQCEACTRTVRSFLLCVFLGSQFVSCALSAPFLVSSWEELNDTIAAEVDKSLGGDNVVDGDQKIFDLILKTPTVQAIFRANNETMWEAMLEQGEFRLVVFAAYSCLSQKHPDSTYHYALRAALSGEKFGIERDYLYSIIASSKGQDISPIDFTTTFCSSRANRVKVAFFIGAVPGSIVHRWFESEETVAAPSYLLASVMMKIHDDLEIEKRSPGKKLKRMIDESADLPGDMKLAFCWCIAEDDPRLPDAMVQILNTPSSRFTNLEDSSVPWPDDSKYPPLRLLAFKKRQVIRQKEKWFSERVSLPTGKNILDDIIKGKF